MGAFRKAILSQPDRNFNIIRFWVMKVITFLSQHHINITEQKENSETPVK